MNSLPLSRGLWDAFALGFGIRLSLLFEAQLNLLGYLDALRH
jgi:hypothetical protein